MYHWIKKTKFNKPWLEIEQHQIQRILIKFLPQAIKKYDYFHFNTISTTLTAWWKTIQITSSTLSICKDSSLWHNPDFVLYNKPIYFLIWFQKQITHLHHLFENNDFIPFEKLIQRYGAGREQFLQYEQIKHVIQTKLGNESITTTTCI